MFFLRSKGDTIYKQTANASQDGKSVLTVFSPPEYLLPQAFGYQAVASQDEDRD